MADPEISESAGELIERTAQTASAKGGAPAAKKCFSGEEFTGEFEAAVGVVPESDSKSVAEERSNEGSETAEAVKTVKSIVIEVANAGERFWAGMMSRVHHNRVIEFRMDQKVKVADDEKLEIMGTEENQIPGGLPIKVPADRIVLIPTGVRIRISKDEEFKGVSEEPKVKMEEHMAAEPSEGEKASKKVDPDQLRELYRRMAERTGMSREDILLKGRKSSELLKVALRASTEERLVPIYP